MALERGLHPVLHPEPPPRGCRPRNRERAAQRPTVEAKEAVNQRPLDRPERRPHTRVGQHAFASCGAPGGHPLPWPVRLASTIWKPLFQVAPRQKVFLRPNHRVKRKYTCAMVGTSNSTKCPLAPIHCSVHGDDPSLTLVKRASPSSALKDNGMRTLLTRRQILASGIAMVGTVSLPPMAKTAAAPESPAAKLRLTAGARTLDVNGKSAQMFGLTGPDAKPGFTLSPGERFRVDLVNEAGTSSIVHWHGQLPPWKQDGFPWPQTPPIAAGDTTSYDYAPIPGTFWMHSHQGLQEQSLMTAPLIVRSADDLRADRQEVVLMLHDFSFHTPEELLAGLIKAGGDQTAIPERRASTMDMGSESMGNMRMGSGSTGRMSMGSGIAMDLNDVEYDAFLANDRTLADPEVIRTEPGGRVLLRLINGASATQFWIDLGALTGTVISVDGHPVRPVRGSRLPLAMAQRLDVLIDLPENGAYPIIAQVEGTRARTGIVLAASGAPVPRLASEAEKNAPPVDLSLERRLEAATPWRRARPM